MTGKHIPTRDLMLRLALGNYRAICARIVGDQRALSLWPPRCGFRRTQLSRLPPFPAAGNEDPLPGRAQSLKRAAAQRTWPR